MTQTEIEKLYYATERLETLENAISAFIGQSGEYDGYLGCYAVSSLTHKHCQLGDVVSSVDELIEWYKENYPKEVAE